MRKKPIWIALLATALVVVAIVWGVQRYRSQQELATVRDLADVALQSEGEARSQAWEQVRQAGDQLSEGQQQVLRQEMRQRFMANRMQEIDAYFALPSSQERNAYLDDRIREMEDRRREAEQRRREREAADGNPNGNDRQPNRDGRGPGGGWGRGPGGGPPGGPGGGRPGGPGGGRGGGSRAERMSRIYDNTTPDQRAKFTAFREAIERRRDELGLPKLERGRGRPR